MTTPPEPERILREYFRDLDKNGRADPAFFGPGFTAEIATVGRLDRDGYIGFVKAIYTGIPDGTHHVQSALSDTEACNFTAKITGTHKGDLMGTPASGKAIEIMLSGRFEVKNGKVARIWAVPDVMSLMRQAGAIPMPGQTA